MNKNTEAAEFSINFNIKNDDIGDKNIQQHKKVLELSSFVNNLNISDDSVNKTENNNDENDNFSLYQINLNDLGFKFEGNRIDNEELSKNNDFVKESIIESGSNSSVDENYYNIDNDSSKNTNNIRIDNNLTKPCIKKDNKDDNNYNIYNIYNKHNKDKPSKNSINNNNNVNCSTTNSNAFIFSKFENKNNTEFKSARNNNSIISYKENTIKNNTNCFNSNSNILVNNNKKKDHMQSVLYNAHSHYNNVNNNDNISHNKLSTQNNTLVTTTFNSEHTINKNISKTNSQKIPDIINNEKRCGAGVNYNDVNCNYINSNTPLLLNSNSIININNNNTTINSNRFNNNNISINNYPSKSYINNTISHNNLISSDYNSILNTQCPSIHFTANNYINQYPTQLYPYNINNIPNTSNNPNIIYYMNEQQINNGNKYVIDPYMTYSQPSYQNIPLTNHICNVQQQQFIFNPHNGYNQSYQINSINSNSSNTCNNYYGINPNNNNFLIQSVNPNMISYNNINCNRSITQERNLLNKSEHINNFKSNDNNVFKSQLNTSNTSYSVTSNQENTNYSKIEKNNDNHKNSISSTITYNKVANDNKTTCIHKCLKSQSEMRILISKIELNLAYLESTVLPEILDNFTEVCLNPYGNHFLNKVIHKLSQKALNKLLKKVKENFEKLYNNSFGTRIIQRLIECLSQESLGKLGKILECFLSILTIDYNGIHIIIKFITTYDECDYIYDYLLKNIIPTATNKDGCCLLQKILKLDKHKIKKVSNHQFLSIFILYYLYTQNELIKELINHIYILIINRFGVYVIEYIVFNINKYTNSIIEKICNDSQFIFLCKKKYSSNLIEKVSSIKSNYKIYHIVITKLIDKSQKETKSNMINYILSIPNVVETLFPDKYGFYVIVKALNNTKDSKQISLMNKVKVSIPLLLKQNFGVSFLEKLRAQYPELI